VSQTVGNPFRITGHSREKNEQAIVAIYSRSHFKHWVFMSAAKRLHLLPFKVLIFPFSKKPQDLQCFYRHSLAIQRQNHMTFAPPALQLDSLRNQTRQKTAAATA
jgi:hypothetical protein